MLIFWFQTLRSPMLNKEKGIFRFLCNNGIFQLEGGGSLRGDFPIEKKIETKYCFKMIYVL